MNDIFTYLIRMPDGMSEFITPNSEDGGFTVYLSDRLTYEQRLNAYAHALKHIHDFDIDCAMTADQIEKRAH